MLGLISLVMPLAAIAAVPVGVIAVRKIARSNGQLDGRGQAIAGIGLGSLIIVGAAMIAVLVVLAPATSQSPSAVFQAGDCLDELPPEGFSATRFSSDQVTACTEPHGAEFAGSSQLPDPEGASYPGQQAVLLAGSKVCMELFAYHVGSPLSDHPELDVVVHYPGVTSWEQGNDREVGCFIIAMDGSPLTQPYGPQ